MENNQKIKGILFDLGGVVIESFKFGFYGDAGKKFGISPKEIERVADEEWAPLERGEETNEQLWHKVTRKLKLDTLTGATLASMWLEHYKRDARIKEEVLDIVKRLRNRYKLGVISNSQREHSAVNRARGLFDNFDTVLLSNEVGMRKPEKEFFEAAARELKLSFDELLFVDDEMRWVEAAQNYGLRAILFESAEQLEKEFEKLGIRVG